MSFAQRFAAGQQIAKGLIDTYQAAKRAGEVDAIVNAKPEEVDSYRIPEGDAGIQAGIDNFKEGDSFVAPGLSPKRTTMFMGKEHDSGLTEKQMGRTRELALADLEMRDNPIKGMQLKRSLGELNRAEDEREEKKNEELGIRDLMTRYNAAPLHERHKILESAPPNYVAGLSKFVEDGKKLSDLQRSATADHFIGLALKKDWDSIVRDYGAYNDGLDAEITQGADGKITVTRTKGGEPHDVLTFKDEYDFATGISSAYNPTAALSAHQTRVNEIAKAEAASKAKVTDAFNVRAAQRQADAVYGRAPSGTSAGASGTQGAPKPEASLADQAVSAWRGVMKNAPSTATQGIGLEKIPELELKVRQVAENAEASGKQIRPEMIAQAVAAVYEGSKKPTPMINPKTGEIDLVVDFGPRSGTVTYDSGIDPSRELTDKESKAAISSALETHMARGGAGIDGMFYEVRDGRLVAQPIGKSADFGRLNMLIKQAAHHETKDGSHMAALSQFIEKQATLKEAGRIAQMRADNVPDSQIQQELQLAPQRVATEKARIARIVDLTRQFGKEAYDPEKVHAPKGSFISISRDNTGITPGDFDPGSNPFGGRQ